MNLLDLLFARQKKVSYGRALAYERHRNANATRSQRETFAEAARQLAGGDGVPFGELPDGGLVELDTAIAFASALVIGATGSGKTRFVLGLIVHALRRLFEETLSALEREALRRHARSARFRARARGSQARDV